MYQITEHDTDTMATAMFTFVTAAELCLRKIQQRFIEQAVYTPEYKQLVKKLGPAGARQYLTDHCKRLIRHDEKMDMGAWLDKAKELYAITERLTMHAIDTNNYKQPDFTCIDLYDAYQDAAKIMIRDFIIRGNIPEEDFIKIESTLKALQKRTENDLAFLEHFSYTTISK